MGKARVATSISHVDFQLTVLVVPVGGFAESRALRPPDFRDSPH
jgi:hypothetical protein